MKLSAAVAGLSGLGLAHALDALRPNHPPTSYQSAVMGRRILSLTKLGTLSTVFPEGSSSSQAHGAEDDEESRPGIRENRPNGLGGMPFGLMDYIADCEGQGNPTILAISIETTFKNARDGSNVTVSMTWTPPYPPAKRIPLLARLAQYLPVRIPGMPQPAPAQAQAQAQAQAHRRAHHGKSGGGEHKKKNPHNHNNRNKNNKAAAAKKERGAQASSSSPTAPDPVPYSAANLPRLALVGYVESVDPSAADAAKLKSCYLAKHPDAKYWLPGGRVHTSQWMRLVVTQVYWLGGFGDRAYIGWIPLDEWQRVTDEEVAAIRLPGEKPGWSEWPLDGVVGEEL